MKCGDASAAIGPSIDGELGVAQRMRMRRHLASCTACAGALRRLEADYAARRGELPRHAAPAALVAALTARFGEPASPATSTRVTRRRWVVAGAAAGCLATVVATVGIGTLRTLHDDADLAQSAVAAHTRATLGDALVQVASDDHHTVKPWLSARLDYSPPVLARVAGPAIGARGDEDGSTSDPGNACVLTGARIDALAGRRVAVLVYRYRAHVVDVFVWPDSGADVGTDATIRGFNVRQGRGHDMRWLAVSDVNTAVLDALLVALRR